MLACSPSQLAYRLTTAGISSGTYSNVGMILRAIILAIVDPASLICKDISSIVWERPLKSGNILIECFFALEYF